MASNVVSIAVQANSEQLTKAFDKGGSSADRFKAKMQLVAKAVVAALAFKAAQAVTDFVGDSIEAFSDLNESLNAVEVTFGDAAEGIKDLGEGAAQNLGLSNSEFNNFAVQMSAFAEEIAGDGGDVVGVIDDLSTRVSDFASVMNLDVADAATKFQAGLAGETEPLRKFGIDVSAAKTEMFALSEGIIEAGEEMTEGQKIQARFGTIMEQTSEVQGDFANTAEDYANAQRIANAEMENAEARAGEALVPFAQMTTQLKELGAKTIGLLSTEILGLTGSLSGVDEAIQRFEINMGKSADSAEAALTIAKDYDGSIKDLITRLDLGRDELEKIRDADEDFLLSMGFTEDQVDDLAGAVGLELASGLSDAEQAARNSFSGIEKFKEGQEDAETATEDTTDSIQDQIDKLRAMSDPFFGALQAVDDLEQAQQDYNTAVEEGDLEGQEDAIRDIAEANINLKEKYQELKDQGIDPASDAGKNAFRDMGLTEAQIETILGQFQELEDNAPTIPVRVKIPDIESRSTAGGNLRWEKGKTNTFQRGGIVTDPLMGLIGEGGDDEAVIPLNSQGIKILGAALREAMGPLVEDTKKTSQPAPLQGATFVLQGTPESLVHDLGRTVGLEVRWA